MPAIARAAAPNIKGTGSVVVFDGGGAWGAAQKAAYFDPFQQETGITVVAAPRSPSSRIRSSILAGAPAYDVADISAGQLAAFRKENLLQRIDYRWFDSADIEAFRPVATGPDMVPSLFYSLLVAYDRDAFRGKGPIDWVQLWDTKAFPGQRTLSAGSNGPGYGAFEVALLADGVDPARLYPLDWDRALRSLDRIRPSVAKFWSAGAEPVQMIMDGNAVAGSAWNGRVSDVVAQGAKLETSWEKGLLQWDAWVVLRGAANVENAMKFLAFSARPDRQAAFAEHIAYGPTNSRAYAQIRPERVAILPTAPSVRDRQVVQNYDFWATEPRPDVTNERVATELWETWVTKR
jgi:putative spermidine/putrescine transport system substrate-binding protein